MKKDNLPALMLAALRARWRLRWAESRHEGSLASVDYLEGQLADARARQAATAQDLSAAQGASKLATDRITMYHVRCGLSLKGRVV